MEGVRVIRGPDWRWGQQDGGEGHTGTLVELMDEGLWAVVQWDKGSRCRYRCGGEGKYDLRVLDVATTSVVHPRLTCTWCDESPLLGTAWRCACCYDYTLCTSCYMADKHSLDHSFNRCDTADLTKRVRVPPRFQATKLPLMGIYPQAKVTRGPDWQWQNQDGGRGNQGHVTKIQGWKNETFRSVAVVAWSGTKGSQVYRRGHRGKVDLICVTAANGGDCYIDHLALLGYKYPEVSELEMSAGDAVMVQADPDVFKVAQVGHGGWDDRMAEMIGRVGVLKDVAAMHGRAKVHYGDNTFLIINSAVLVKVSVPVFHNGEVVRVIDDMVKVHSQQSGHGEWNDDMALALGQLGRIVNVNGNYDVTIIVNGRRWIFNPESLEHVSEIVAHEYLENEPVLTFSPRHQQELAVIVQTGLPDVIVAAAELGDEETLRNYLNKNPHEVNHKHKGHSGLHRALLQGHTSIIKTILEFDPNLNIKDDEGETPLHRCARMDNPVAAKLLIEAGADVNVKEFRGVTPIMMAAALGHAETLEAILASPVANVNIQDESGATPLHRCIHIHHRSCVRLLLEHGANPVLCNFELQTPLFDAAGKGFFCGVEEILRFYPQHINQKKDDGFTTFHIAATNDQAAVFTYMASFPSCDMNVSTKNRLTPLHTAVHEGYIITVEKLVGLGVDLNAPMGDGVTPLHLALAKCNMRTPSNDTPQIKEIQDEVEAEHGKGLLSANMIVALFLVANGADVHIKDLRGRSPLSICPRDSAAVLSKYAAKGSTFHGSFRPFLPKHMDLPKPVKHRHITTGDGMPLRARTDTIQTLRSPSTLPTIHRSYSSPPEAIVTGTGRVQLVTRPPLPEGGLGQLTTTPPHGVTHGLPQAVTPPPVAGNGHGQVVTPPPAAGGHVQVVTPPPVASGCGQLVTPPPVAANGHAEDIGKEAIREENGLNNLFDAVRISEQKTANIRQCFLCEGGADIKLSPCGHVNMCHDCPRPKKCPECRVVVEMCDEVCVMCWSSAVGRTMQPCGHTYCSGCGNQSEFCEACRRFKDDS